MSTQQRGLQAQLIGMEAENSFKALSLYMCRHSASAHGSHWAG